MAEIKDTKIPDLSTSWENYSGSRVEEFLKEQLSRLQSSLTDGLATKAGYIALLSSDPTNGMATVGIFASEETYGEWKANQEE